MKKIIVSFLFIFLSLLVTPHAATANVQCGGATCQEGQICEIGPIRGEAGETGERCVNNPSNPSPEQNSSSGGSNRFVPLAPIPGLTDGDVANSANLPVFFNNLYKFLVGASAILAIIMIIWGGFEISTQDSISKHANGKERITQAILGLIIVLSPVLVFSIINPRILNLSVSLTPLNIPQPVNNSPQSTFTQARSRTYSDYECSNNDCDAARQLCTDAGGTAASDPVCPRMGGMSNTNRIQNGRCPLSSLHITCGLP